MANTKPIRIKIKKRYKTRIGACPPTTSQQIKLNKRKGKLNKKYELNSSLEKPDIIKDD
jgi:hypothetical protein